MIQIHNIIKNKKNDNIKCALEDLERNENDTMKMHEALKKIKRLAPKEKLIILTEEGLTSNEKAVRNHSKILQKHFLHKRNTNAERITNADVNTIHIIRSKKSSMDSKK